MSTVRRSQGVGRLAFDAIEQVVNVVEAMHANIAARPLPFGRGTDGRTGGVTGLVYDGVRLASQGSRTALDRALDALSAQRETDSVDLLSPAVSALNGVLGDYLERTANPLAIEMQFRRNGRKLDLDRKRLNDDVPGAGGRLLIVAHGLCMNDALQRRQGHDHGESLAANQGLTAVYLTYNSGRHVSQNGRELAGLLEELVEEWPAEVTELNLLGHSMGGLVFRSACHYAEQARHRWPRLLQRMVSLGTPHHGAPLERGGNLFQEALGKSPYTEPLSRLGWLRSAGITDLRHGSLLDEDWSDADRFERRADPRCPVALPDGVGCYAVAATTGRRLGDLNDRMLGDGLVPVASALGRHRDERRSLAFPESHRWIRYGIHHLDLLSDPKVYDRLRDWFGSPAPARGAGDGSGRSAVGSGRVSTPDRPPSR